MRAAEAKNLTMVELLLARGADVNARDDQSRTALVRARGDETARMIEAAGGVK
jgi:ankyrin repeat protein